MNGGTLSALLRDLVAIESPSGSEAAIAADVHGRLAACKIDAQIVGQSVVACLDLGRGPRLLLNSHLDTVPIGQGWTQTPIGGQWNAGRLYGRGSNDAKASVAAMLWALWRLSQRPRSAQFSGQILLSLSACEETTNAGMTEVLAHVGTVDAGITGEPTGLEVVRAQSGLAVLQAEWRGRSCHSAHVGRVNHENALLAATRELSKIDRYVTLEQRHELLGESTIVPTVMRAGERHNVVPDRAEVLFDARLAPPHLAVHAKALLESRLPGAAISIRSERLRPMDTAADHPLVREALGVAGRNAALGSSTLSDMALLQGIPAIKCGPGETARSHTSDEFVLLGELEQGAQFYEQVVPRVLAALTSVGVRNGA